MKKTVSPSLITSLKNIVVDIMKSPTKRKVALGVLTSIFAYFKKTSKKTSK